MPLTSLLPFLAAIVTVFAMTLLTVRSGPRARRAWWLPAGISLVFLGFSLWAVVTEGPLGFWHVHTTNRWGNQVWFDLLIAISLGWYLVLPRLRTVGMNPWPWLILVLATGCIGFSALIARLRWLESRADGVASDR
jgi:hypothetical protein